MLGENIRRENTVVFSEKRSFTGAVVNLKKLFKTVKRIFTHSKPANMAPAEIDGESSFASEEDLQNWLNEQLEAKAMALH
ncbi:uncharacterized protein LOC6558183 [Drosophila grimshawi]|uniref:GH16933 n=1 Tax=Drosophila grimshawi TaxID=7222 RepID=B4IY11_DROGR|nr:uncharacterized protein LOC6558183 [Drosophila grimshawi]EDV97554.1 GH16933 [Drosophila grimshawi]